MSIGAPIRPSSACLPGVACLYQPATACGCDGSDGVGSGNGIGGDDVDNSGSGGCNFCGGGDSVGGIGGVGNFDLCLDWGSGESEA